MKGLTFMNNPGYPDQALQRSHEGHTLAQALAHPATQALGLYGATRILHLRRDVPETHEQAEATIAFEIGRAHV